MLYSQAAVHCICDNFCVEEKVWKTNVVLLIYYVCFSNIIPAVGVVPDVSRRPILKHFMEKADHNVFFNLDADA